MFNHEEMLRINYINATMVYVTVKNKVDYLMTWEMLQNIV